MLKSRVWKIQKLEIDLKQHKKCYEFYVCRMDMKVCDECIIIIDKIIKLQKEMRDLIEVGVINEHCKKCGVQLLQNQNMVKGVVHRMCKNCIEKIVKNIGRK